MLTDTWAGYMTLAAFAVAYALVIMERRLKLHKSKPMLLLGCLMWAIIALYERLNGVEDGAGRAINPLVADISEIFFFVLTAMTYINTLQERLVFDSLKLWLIRKGYGFKRLFWITGLITFFLSAIADNLTSALLMGTLVNAVGAHRRRFLLPAFINIIVAANAGGAWSPFGDITTLMVWTAGKVHTARFLALFLPSLANWAVPALIMSFFVPPGGPAVRDNGPIVMKHGARLIIALGLLTIAVTVFYHHYLRLPAFLGMMTGLGLLFFMGYYIKKAEGHGVTSERQFNIFRQVQRAEFDTLLFFFGIMIAIGALSYTGALELAGGALYSFFGATRSNVLIGALSAIVDNIPVTYSVLQIEPDMGSGEWLLLTLTAGTGGSLLSIGSAAGVAVMGIRRDILTFGAYLRWTPAIALGYLAGIGLWRLLS